MDGLEAASDVREGKIARTVVLSHTGLVRKDNQDRVGQAECPTMQLAVVADGVGGEAGGARAAEIAVQNYVELLASCQDIAPGQIAADALQRATQTIQREIAAAREADSALHAMASTVAVVCLQPSRATIGHLGDARVYLFRAGELSRLTEDHSLVRRMVRDGLITEEESLVHPQGHILTRSLGQPEGHLDLSTRATMEHDLFLLCSDGLWSCVPDELLSRELNSAPSDLASTANRLLALALEKGAPDNVSLALLQVHQSEHLKEMTGSSGPMVQGEVTARLRSVLIVAMILGVCSLLLFVILRAMSH